ncbi:TorF family putative porin [Orrella daihaiensis]|uniref:TorF family putative porin n=1 Tax=Orrella daihaiensis TaxID=2782176 RepID=UPI00350F91CE
MMNTKRLLSCILAAPVLAISANASAEGTDLGHGFNLSGNITVINDYRFRGYTQTNFKPAAQVGIDLTHESGFYIGNWNSNVGWTTGTSLEMDFYGGWSGEVQGIGLDVGVIQYAYPGADMEVSPNTFEIYAGVSKGPFGLKVYYTPTNWFGYADSKNAWYFDGSAGFDLGDGWSIGLHAGYQVLQNVTNADGNNVSGYFDYKAGISKDIKGWVFDLSVVGASTDDLFLSSQGHPAGRVGALFSIAKSF